MSKLTHKDDNRASPFPPASPNSVWQIMRSSVNDNSPGYFYWIFRIGIASAVCALIIGLGIYLFS